MAAKRKLNLDKKMSPKFVNIIVVTVLIILSIAVLANAVSKPVARDEQMYVTGAVLLAQGKMIYRDFSYAAQMPYHPLLCAALFKLFGTTYYLLAGRAVSCVCDILVMLSIVGIFRHIFRSFTASGTILGLCAAALYIFNPLVDYANGYAWNHDVVIFCVVLSFWLFISTDFQQKSRYWRAAAIGALLTFATFMRITTVLVELLFLVVLLSIRAGSVKERFKNVLPFLLAVVVVSIWPVWVIAQAPRAFFLDVVKIPMLYGRWLREIGMVHNKLTLTFACLTTPGYFVLLLVVIYLGFSVFFLRRRLKITGGINLLLAALLPAVFFAIALIPPTMWRQYLAVPVPFLVFALAFPLLYLRRLTSKAGISGHFKIATGLMIISALVALLSYPVVLYRTPVALVRESWVPVEIHKVSEEIVAKANDPKLILTLGPLLALEGGGEIYTGLSAGAIIYRIADFLSAEQRRTTHTVGPQELPELVKERPPSAVILGIEMGRLEKPVYELVVKSDWERKEYDNGLIVYFRP
jgi:4-amino-4-deoxy-L-arabinose transferase-like glycosyltransferase